MTGPVPLEVEEIRLSPGEEWLTESKQWRFLFLGSGTAYWLDQAKPRQVAQGELLFVAPGLKGIFRASQLGEAVLHWFGFEPKSLLGFFSFEEREWIENCAQAAECSIGCLPSTHPISKEMGALLKSVPRDCELVERGKALVVALRVLTLSMPAASPAGRRGGAARERFEQIVCHMPDSELMQHSSEELAKLCGCTARHFSRLFRGRFGSPARVRQTELRLLKARHLLESSDGAVVKIAADCGYSSLSLFNSLFRRRFGMSPSEWRRSASR